jgi:hypothetical protein
MIMTTGDDNDSEEELYLTQQLLDARARLEEHKKESSRRRFEQNELEARVEEAERALFDYCEGNCVTQCHPGPYSVSITTAEFVNVSDPDAVPEAFCRIKREPNKVLIRELRPQGNWYNINSNPSIRIVRNHE